MATSEKIDQLVKALIQAKGEFSKIERKKKNPFFNSKYADLATIDSAVMPALHKNGITVVQTTDMSGIQLVLVTMLVHESGQFITGNYPLNPVKNDPQGLGSATTYARRYALSAMLAVVSDDDDGNGASRKPETVAKTGAQDQPAYNAGKRVITDAQARNLYKTWKKAHRQDDEVREYIKITFGFNSTKEITQDTYEAIEKWILSNEPVQQPDPEPIEPASQEFK